MTTRKMAEIPPGFSWHQPTLFRPAASLLIIRVGHVPAAEHWQIQLEEHDTTAGTLIRMESCWHTNDADVRAVTKHMVAAWVEEGLGPF